MEFFFVATKLERGGGTALVAGPLKKTFFCGFPYVNLNFILTFINFGLAITKQGRHCGAVIQRWYLEEARHVIKGDTYF